jgi:hypothetical protein
MTTDGFQSIEDIDPDNDPVPVLIVVDPTAETPPS